MDDFHLHGVARFSFPIIAIVGAFTYGIVRRCPERACASSKSASGSR